MPPYEHRTLLPKVAGVTALTLAVSVLAGCYSAPPQRVVTTATIEQPATVVTVRPPPVREEVIPVAPNERVVWDPGRWSWDGRAYVWVAGHYVERPYARAVWEPGHWVDHGGGWVWDEGHWQG